MRSPSRCYQDNDQLTGKARDPLRTATTRRPCTVGVRISARGHAAIRPARRFSRYPGHSLDRSRSIGPGREAGKITAHGRRFLFCVLSYWALAGAAVAEWHRGNLTCGSCHLASEVNTTNAGQLVADEASLCLDCHQNAVKASHPVGVRPTFEPPAGLPLDSKGEVTCSTCHLLHGQEDNRLRPGHDGQQLCESCHQPDFFSAMKDGGISLMALGHLDAGAPFSGNIDNFSIQCLACHENSGDAPLQRAGAAGGGTESAKTNHPIGLSYSDSLGFGGYRHPNRLPDSILLPDGKLSCLSCHVGYSRSHGALVIENRADNLCTACHSL